MKIAIIGAGHVGLVTGVCFAEIGHDVLCIDNDQKKIARLKNRKVTFYEPRLGELLKKNMKRRKLGFSARIDKAVDFADVIFIAVGTPPQKDGSANLFYVENVAKEIAANMKKYKVIVEKSTVPVATGERIIQTIRMNNKMNVDFDVVSNPEFLREGSAVYDTLNPDRIVVGVSSKRSENLMRRLYAPIKAPFLVTDIKSAEIIKHASNSFLATKISFINAVANICEKVGADIEMVAKGIGMDSRIGLEFLNAGIGYGGSCFPKDVAAFRHISGNIGYDFNLLKAVEKINEDQKRAVCRKLHEVLWILKGKTVGLLGLSFKPNTDDMRDAPVIDIIQELKNSDVRIRAYDPVSMENAKKIISGVKFCKDAYETARKSHALIIITEWDEFRSLDMEKIKKLMEYPVIIDGRNLFSPSKMLKKGFIYRGIGR